MYCLDRLSKDQLRLYPFYQQADLIKAERLCASIWPVFDASICLLRELSLCIVLNQTDRAKENCDLGMHNIG